MRLAALALSLAALWALWFRTAPTSARAALALDPASPYRWADLNRFDRAVELGPNIPPILMRAANFYFAAGNTRAALASTRRILSLVREYDEAIFASYSRWNVPLAEVLAHGFPPDPAPRRAYFRYVLASGDAARAARLWDWLARREDAGLYYDFLLDRREYRAAAALGAIPAKIDPVRFDHAGNIAYSRLCRRIVVEPGRYTFRALIRTQGLTTDEGLRFRIVDAESPARLDVSTGQATGTNGWRPLTAAVTIGPATHVLRIELTRRPSLKFDNDLSGAAWIEGVELAPSVDTMTPSP